MTLPANIRINMGAPFPAQVKGGGVVAVSKQNGIWTVSLNYGALPLSLNVPNPGTTYTLVWDAQTGIFYMIPLSAVSSNKVVRIITTPGPQAAQPSDDVLIINQAAGAAFTLNVDWSKRTKPLQVVDGKGDARLNNISIVPAAGQTQLAVVNFVYVIDGNGGNVILTPLPNGSGAY